jgi:hypothetical protein
MCSDVHGAYRMGQAADAGDLLRNLLHLKTLDFTFRGDFKDALTGLQQLLGRSTLVRARMACTFSDSDDFIHIWDRRSPTIRHVELECWEPRVPVLQGAFLLPRENPISFEALHIVSIQDRLHCDTGVALRSLSSQDSEHRVRGPASGA